MKILIAVGVVGVGYVIYAQQAAVAAAAPAAVARPIIPPGSVFTTNATLGRY